MIISMSVESHEIFKKLLLINIIGALTGLKEKKLSIEETEKFIFSPRSLTQAKLCEVPMKIRNIIAKGCELEDINSIIPDKLNETIDNLLAEALELLNNTEKQEIDNWIYNLKLSQ